MATSGIQKQDSDKGAENHNMTCAREATMRKNNGAPSISKLNHNHQTTDTKKIENRQKPTTPHESPKTPQESPKNLTLSKASLNPV